MNTLVYPTTCNRSLLPVRVFCTHETAKRNVLHFEDIPSEELFNQELIVDRRCKVCGMPLLLDNRFLVESYLGSGGFSRTWLAVDLSDDSLQEKSFDNKPKRVVKQFSPQITSLRAVEYQDLKRRFEEEAFRLSSLEHPQIPKIIQYFEIDKYEDNVRSKKYLYIVQEYIEGKNLKELNASFSVDEIISMLYQILNILEYLHGKGVIHRDIKPENIIYSNKENKYYLIDFGAAKNVAPLVEHSDCFPDEEDIDDPFVYIPPQAMDDGRGTRIGTPGFVAPEQWKDRKAVFASDQYSLAATCVYLLTQSDEAFCENFIHSQQWKQFIPNHFETNSELLQILSKMLMLNPAERFHSPSEILVALKQIYSPETPLISFNSAAIPMPFSGIRNHLFDPIKRNLISRFSLYKNLALFSLSGLIGFGFHYLLYASSSTLNTQKKNHSPASIVSQSVRAHVQNKTNNRETNDTPSSSLGSVDKKIELNSVDVKDDRSNETLARPESNIIPKTSPQDDRVFNLNEVLEPEQNKILKINQRENNQTLKLSNTPKTKPQHIPKPNVNNTPKKKPQNTKPKVNKTPKTKPQGSYLPNVNKSLKTTSQNNRKLKLSNVLKPNQEDISNPKVNENLESKMDKILKIHQEDNRKPKWDNTIRMSQQNNRKPKDNTTFESKIYRIKSKIPKIFQPDQQNNREPKVKTNIELKVHRIKSKIHKIFQSDRQEES